MNRIWLEIILTLNCGYDNCSVLLSPNQQVMFCNRGENMDMHCTANVGIMTITSLAYWGHYQFSD